MPLYIVRQDITKMDTDAIVNAANNTLLGGGGVDGAIHRAAGPRLLEECRTLGGCETGDAKITGAYDLPCRYVIHTVGPVWWGGNFGEQQLLTSCYKRSLELALQNGCSSIAFPLISSGVYGYPRKGAFDTAVAAITEFLQTNDLDVYLTIFGNVKDVIESSVYNDIALYISSVKGEDVQQTSGSVCYAESSFTTLRAPEKKRAKPFAGKELKAPESNKYAAAAADTAFESESDETVKTSALSAGLDERLRQLDESFTEMLLRKIDEKGIKDSECYKKANVDRKLFSKIRSDRLYRPSKPTAIAFAIALELSLADTKELLMKAGFALSHSSKFDIIIEYFISKGSYDIFEINEALFAFDQAILG